MSKLYLFALPYDWLFAHAGCAATSLTRQCFHTLRAYEGRLTLQAKSRPILRILRKKCNHFEYSEHPPPAPAMRVPGSQLNRLSFIARRVLFRVKMVGDDRAKA